MHSGSRLDFSDDTASVFEIRDYLRGIIACRLIAANWSLVSRLELEMKKRILFVDDDGLNISEYASRFIGSSRYEVNVIDKFTDFVANIENIECDYAFVDLMMDPEFVDLPAGFTPDKVGLFAAAAIRERNPNAYVMIMTGSHSVDIDYLSSLSFVDLAVHKSKITPIEIERLVSGEVEQDASPSEDFALLKHRMFIGSSGEGLSIAEAIQSNLDHAFEVTIWSQGVFGLSSGTLETLVDATKDFDFAVLVLTPDDLVKKRGQRGYQARDNVLFELGLFMGSLGRHRTFIVHQRNIKIDIPTDLAGITPATFAARTDGNLMASLGPACTQIKTAVGKAIGALPG